jgi:hypothetical protein
MSTLRSKTQTSQTPVTPVNASLNEKLSKKTSHNNSEKELFSAISATKIEDFPVKNDKPSPQSTLQQTSLKINGGQQMTVSHSSITILDSKNNTKSSDPTRLQSSTDLRVTTAPLNSSTPPGKIILYNNQKRRPQCQPRERTYHLVFKTRFDNTA